MAADQPRTVAVFDVDETLIRCKSMFSFLEFALVSTRGAVEGRSAFRAVTEDLRHARATAGREEVNRRFYRHFAGWVMADLAGLAQAWFSGFQPATLYHSRALARLEWHRMQGHRVVLLSGSADFILAPIARELAAQDVLAVRLRLLADGATDGEIEGVQTIGQGKADALSARLAHWGGNPVLYGYGDHESDLPFLRLCHRAFCVLRADAALPDWAAGLARLDTEVGMDAA